MKDTDGKYYDFSEERLWLTRFLPINDAIQTVEQHLADTVISLDGVSLEYIDQFLEKRKSQGLSILKDLKQMILHKLQAIAFLQGTPFEKVSEVLNDEAISERVAEGLTNLLDDKLKGTAKGVTHFIKPEMANSESVEDVHDRDFELIQLMNLGTFSHSLRQFVGGPLFASAKASLANDNGHASTWLIRACFQHVFEDIQIIEQAITQRSWQLIPDGKKQMGPQARALLVSDKLAMMALAPAKNLLPANRPQHPILPITFFSQDTHIHHTPYRDDLLLIGISSDHIMLGLNRDEAAKGSELNIRSYLNDALPAFELMAIPHEVGHYLYQHGQLLGEPIAEITGRIFGHYPRLFNWREEIFADIYSCVVAGSLSALGLQALLTTSNNGTICTNDGEHPTGNIRPFILTKILSLLHNELGDRYPIHDVSAQLAENWQWNLELRNIHLSSEPIPFEPIYELMLMLIEELDLEPEGQTIQIPWSHAFHPSLKKYDHEMEQLIQTVFSIKEMPDHKLADEVDQNEKLALPDLLAKWGDDWDTPKGRGTLGDQNSQTNNQNSQTNNQNSQTNNQNSQNSGSD